jgi:hypothetical protein
MTETTGVGEFISESELAAADDPAVGAGTPETAPHETPFDDDDALDPLDTDGAANDSDDDSVDDDDDDTPVEADL